VHVEFRGVKVAAVYPEQLPNIAAGTQQILVGRYLPEAGNQQGEIVVTGKRGGEEVKYVAKMELGESGNGKAESGESQTSSGSPLSALGSTPGSASENSFIPRLWARAHLDHLLAQGSSEAIQSDIIRLSEEFHIITPYISLLVLESDADRERLAVQRRYEMRDGERFFADGRDNANFELVQQQMKRAGDWRLGIRREILRNLAGLGRDTDIFREQIQALEMYSRISGIGGSFPMSGAYSENGLITYDMVLGDNFSGGFGGMGGMGGGMGGGGSG